MKNKIENKELKKLIKENSKERSFMLEKIDKIRVNTNTELLKKQNSYFVDFFVSKGWKFEEVIVNKSEYDYSIYYVYDNDGFGFSFSNDGKRKDPSSKYNTYFEMDVSLRLQDIFISGSNINYECFKVNEKWKSVGYLVYQLDMVTLDAVYDRFNKKLNKKTKSTIFDTLSKIEKYKYKFRMLKLEKLNKKDQGD